VTETVTGGVGPGGDQRDLRNYVVVSADAHASPDDLDHFLSYVDPKNREQVAAFGDLSSVAIPMFGGVDPGESDDPDPVRAVAVRRLAGMGVDTAAARDWFARYDADWVIPGDGGGRRLAVLEEQGVHAEVTYPGPVLAGGISPAMYLGGHTAKGLDAVWPALHAYNRWLAEFCAAAPGRRAGVLPIDLHDLDTAVDEIAWARSAGITGGIMLPAMSIPSRLPGYADDYYDPLWRACEEHQMVVNLHTGASGMATDAKYLYDEKHSGSLGLFEVFVFTRRPLWFLILGGVFDRHPGLKVTVTENGVQWLPSLVRDMEQFFDTHGGAPLRRSLRQRPADYVAQHVHLGGSLMQRADAEMRHEIGVDRLMWGADYPHLEGAAPVHREVLQNVFGGLPEPEVRQILGGNAVGLWGFDGSLLQAVADRVGPTVEDLRTPLASDDIVPVFSWSLARPVPLAPPGEPPPAEAPAAPTAPQMA
jgi:predicted TIM-barrel fold metal-dependent hydrolase